MGTRARDAALFCLVLCCGLALAIYLDREEFAARAIYNHDHRQAPHWATYHTPAEHSNNLILQYAEHNESPLQNAIYWVGTFFLDSLQLSKFLGVASFGLLTALFFLVGRVLWGARVGVLMALFFVALPDTFEYSSGFFSKFWAVPLVLVCVFVLQTERWRWLVALLPFAAVAYPMMAVVLGLIAAMDLCQLLVSDRARAKKLFVWLSLASAAAIAVLLAKYWNPPDFLGEMHSTEDMKRTLRERAWTFPSVTRELASHVATPFLLYSSIFYLIVLGRRRIVWERTWTSVLLAAVLGYWLADLVFPRLYIPDRYLRYSIVVLAVLWQARNLDAFLARIGRPWLRVLALVAALACAFWLCIDTFKRADDLRDATELAAISSFIRELPADTLLAGPPYELDDIVVISGKPAMHNYLMDHRWYVQHKRAMHERTMDVFQALYAEDNTPVNALHEKYGATHLVVPYSYFKERLRSAHFDSRYDRTIKTMLGNRRSFFLSKVPKDSVIYDDGKIMIVKLPTLE